MCEWQNEARKKGLASTLVRTLLPPLACSRAPPGVGGTAPTCASQSQPCGAPPYSTPGRKGTFLSSSSPAPFTDPLSLLSMTSLKTLWLRELRSFQSVLAVRRLASPRWMTSRTDLSDVTTSSRRGVMVTWLPTPPRAGGHKSDTNMIQIKLTNTRTHAHLASQRVRHWGLTDRGWPRCIFRGRRIAEGIRGTASF